MCGVSRVQQLAGVGDPAALAELQVLVDRARQPYSHVFRRIPCSLDELVVLGVSDASFGGMPGGRSQGGTVLLLAHPKVMHGVGQAAVISFHSGLLKRVVRSSLATRLR